jgi:hypothetical protein
MDGTPLVAGAVTFQSQTTAATTVIADTTEVLVFTTAVANAADMLSELDDLTIADGSSIADGDDLLVLWTDGTDTYLSSVNLLITDPGGADINIDDGTNTNSTLVTLVGVDIADLTADNFAVVA